MDKTGNGTPGFASICELHNYFLKLCNTRNDIYVEFRNVKINSQLK
jgi:hypothetical protein